jgi:septum formation protein
MQLVLASTSPYRRELLARLGLAFTQVAPDVDESPLPSEAPAAIASRLARAKAGAVARAHAGAWVIGSDQVAELDGQGLGKPGGRERAVGQLRAMSGRSVRFHTAVCVAGGEPGASPAELVDTTTVRFRTLDDAEIARYVDREQAFDAAGSFKAEGLGIALFDAIESRDPTALIGLPLIGTARLLRRCGFAVP